MTLLLIQIHSETNIFLSTKVIWKREKRGFISFSLTNTVQPDKQEMFMKNGNEDRDVLGDSRKRYRCPWAEIGKYWPGKEPIRLQDSLSCPLKKKIIFHQVCLYCPFSGYEVTMKTNHCWDKRADRSIFWFRTCGLEWGKFSSLTALLGWVQIKTSKNFLALLWLFCVMRWFMKLTRKRVYFRATSYLWVTLFKVLISGKTHLTRVKNFSEGWGIVWLPSEWHKENEVSVCLFSHLTSS